MKSLSIRYNWAEILFYGFFMAYGFFGAAAPSIAYFSSHPMAGILQITLLSLLLVLLGIAGWKWGEDFEEEIVISPRDLVGLGIIFAVLFGLGYKSLRQSLQGDETAYLVIAFGHAIKTLLKFSDYLTIIGSWPAKYLIQAISIFLVGVLAAFIYFTRKFAWPWRIAFVLGALIFCRVLVMSFGGNPSPHPPLGGLVHLVFGAAFGVNDFALKAAYFAVYGVFIFGIYKVAAQEAPQLLSMLFALAVGSIPLSLHLATIVENSIWSLISFSLVMLTLATSKKQNYVRLASLVSIATLCRQPVFIAYVPILIMFAATLHKPYTVEHGRNLLKIVVPSVIFVPFLLTSLIQGTPATPALGDQTNQLARVWAAFGSGVVLVALANSVPKLWLLFIPSAFVWWREYRVQSISYMAFFVAGLVIYYSILPALYGLGKYQAEYALPFAIAGAFIFFKILLTTLKHNLIVFSIALLIGFNVVNFVGISTQNKPMDELMDSLPHDLNTYDSGYHVLCGFPFEFGQAYEEVKRLGLTQNSYSIGTTYGVFLEITNGYSLASLQEAESISRFQRRLYEASVPDSSFKSTVENIGKDLRIKAVILGWVPKRDQLLGELSRHGWIVHSKYKNDQYGSSVIVMKKLQS
jgi:hypothetical protein